MTFDISDYDEIQIYISDGWREWYIPKFRLTWVVDEPYITLYWTDTEKGSSGIRRKLELDYQDVSFGYTSPSSAAEIESVLENYIISAFGGSSGTGDVVGPASAVDSNFAAFDGVTGKLIKDSGFNSTDFEPTLGYTPENSANKTDTMAGNTASSTKYLSAKGVYDWAIATFQTIITAASWGDFIVALTGKTTPANADTIVISDSAASDDAKKVTLTNFWTNYLKPKADALYAAINASAGGILGGTYPSPTFSNGTSALPHVTIQFNSMAASTLTDQAAAEQFIGNTNRNITRFDFTGYTSIKLVIRVTVASASANSPRIKIKYDLVSGGFSTAIANFTDIGTGSTEVAVSLAATGVIDSGWIAIDSAAKADCYLTLAQIGGDGAADPSMGYINVFVK